MAKGMTFQEAHAFDKPALWVGAEDEFLLNTQSGIVWWRPRGDDQVQHGDSWKLLPRDRAIPQEGWAHGPAGDCRFCR